MAVIVATRTRIASLNSEQYLHHPYRAAAQVLPGHVCIWNASGYVTASVGAPAAGIAVAGIALSRRDPGGQAVELFQWGFISGYDVSALAFGALLYAGATGELDTAGTVIIGEVLPFGYEAVKMAWIDVTRSWLLA
jgi:hypothetical protein